MPLPSGIFESFQENPGTDLDATIGISVLDTIPDNSPLAKMLGKSSQIIAKQAIPEQNSYAPRSDYETNVQPQENAYSREEREIPTTEELLRKIKSGPKKLYEAGSVQTQPVQQYQPVQQPIYSAPQTQVIDYSLINSMLKSIVEEQFKGIKSQLLTESKKSGVSEATYMTIGNTIKFVDKRGNVYEGKLKLIGNAND